MTGDLTGRISSGPAGALENGAVSVSDQTVQLYHLKRVIDQDYW